MTFLTENEERECAPSLKACMCCLYVYIHGNYKTVFVFLRYIKKKYVKKQRWDYTVRSVLTEKNAFTRDGFFLSSFLRK